MAESGNYRVEVLVFSHLDSSFVAQERDEIRSFANVMQLDEIQPQAAPVQLDVMSTMMQDSWRRLKLSASYRPLLFASWEQSRIDYHPPVRLHDEDMIAEHLHFPHRVAFVDLRSADMFKDYRAPYYRLDGTAQLVRSRFLHLNLDLEFRQELLPRPVPEMDESPPVDILFAQPAEQQPSPVIPFFHLPEEEGEPPEEVMEPGPGPALVYSLQQSRQTRVDQMQYFDTPFLGALVRVTATSGQ
jgi:hypothetical protein